ncbi:hypothetical protein GCM10028858_16950 [Halorubrum pallidum]
MLARAARRLGRVLSDRGANRTAPPVRSVAAGRNERLFTGARGSGGMSDDSEITGHARGVVVTTICALAGIAAGVVSAAYVGTDPVDAGSTTLVVVLAAFVLVQYPLYKVIGVSDFGAKDNLYVAFLTFTLWFISYTVLAVSGVDLVA